MEEIVTLITVYPLSLIAMDDLTLKPVYEFVWSDGSTRRTDELAEWDEAHPDALENLATLGREDPDCSVTLVGMES